MKRFVFTLQRLKEFREQTLDTEKGTLAELRAELTQMEAELEHILEELAKLNRELGVTVVVITHEMRVVEQICGRVAILDQGRVQETGPVSEVFANPQSNAGRRLVLPEGEKIHVMPQNRLVRLVYFQGETAAAAADYSAADSNPAVWMCPIAEQALP